MKVKVSCNPQEAITIEDSAPQTVRLRIHAAEGKVVKVITLSSIDARLLADNINYAAKWAKP